MSIRHTGKHSIVATPSYRVHRRTTVILSAIVVNLSLIVMIVANQVYFNETGGTLIPGISL
ncbi:hypothetical protein GOARA_004_00170 [Gordonia araii NBRC 100433]|uniref:Uncharacterized protein n=1 Tax=Gordonia araii NBRC 100433 TaxID=1073574 RepID=G7GX52_9ACTN|nr:hypothetical protein [Gordonia araii]NNG98192.1 hypothetical protein [Gordonia araii NBRC 100433]GAB08177.1 hypothetical protein GOARA_004_00170 [Gordonia araii NBRC 100433]